MELHGKTGIAGSLSFFHRLFILLFNSPLGVPDATLGTGSAKRWRPCTPAMAAGLTDHVWSLKEVLLYRVPPWPQPQIV
jgi:hypothetical protein